MTEKLEMTDKIKKEQMPEETGLMTQELNLLYHQLSSKANYLYKFVNLFKSSFHRPRDYDNTGRLINMVEIHDLTFIDDNPGVTATTIADVTLRTRGAVSQVLAKLEGIGLIRRVPCRDNGKTMHIYTTEEGKKLSDAHKRFDVRMLRAMHNVLLEEYAQEQIDCFYDVLEFFASAMEEGGKKRKARAKADGARGKQEVP